MTVSTAGREIHTTFGQSLVEAMNRIARYDYAALTLRERLPRPFGFSETRKVSNPATLRTMGAQRALGKAFAQKLQNHLVNKGSLLQTFFEIFDAAEFAECHL